MVWSCIGRTFVGLCLLGSVFGTARAGQPGWQFLAPLAEERSGHGVAMVHTGDVVIVGGHDAAGRILNTSWVMDGTTGQRRPVLGTDPQPRTRSAVIVVPLPGAGSAVYVIGGYSGTAPAAGPAVSSDIVARLRHDVASNQWRWETVGRLPATVGDCRAVYNGRGSIIVSGGRTQAAGAPGSGTYSSATAAIDVATGTIRRLGDHVTARADHGAYRFVDQTGALVVMAAGGEAMPPRTTELLAGTTWDPRANAPLADRRTAVPVSDISGTARVFGGENTTGPLATCEWYDPKSGWRTAPRMNQARFDFDATLIAGPSDTATAYLAVAGMAASPLQQTEIFTLPTSSDPTGGWTPFDALNVAARGRRTAMTSVNLPVVVGGAGTATVEVYQPLRVDDVTFPSTEVGARSDSVAITITNTWMLPITIRSLRLMDGADFIIAVDTTVIVIPAGRSRSILAWFRPSTPGRITSRVVADMGIVADTFRLSGNGLASTVEVATAVMDHGDVAVNTTSRICLPLLRNNGTDTTWVDSIVIDPPGSFIVESPNGRTPVPPGEELLVCILFRPTQRGAVAGTATMHIGPRSYSAAVIGNGIRTYAAIQGRPCDTVSALPGDTIIVPVIIENRGDRPVTITAMTLTASVAGAVELADPMVVPMTLQPAAIVVVDLRLIVQREGQESIRVQGTSNSDEAIDGTVCIVTRSRSLIPSISGVDVGTLCVGDSVTTTVILTNASAVESIDITDLQIENTDQASVLSPAPITVQPRSALEISVMVNALRAGPINGRVVVNTTNGSTIIPVTGTVGDAITLGMPSAQLAPGSTVRLPLTIDGLTSPQLVVDLAFAHDALAIASMETSAGQPAVLPTSSVTRRSNRTTLNIDLASVPTGPTSITLVMEALRGASLTTELKAVRPTGGLCVIADTGVVTIDPSCGQERSRVIVGEGAMVTMQPHPVNDIGIVNIVSIGRADLALRVVDAAGATVLQTNAHAGSTSLDLSPLPSGLYLLQLLSSHGVEDSMSFLHQP